MEDLQPTQAAPEVVERLLLSAMRTQEALTKLRRASITLDSFSQAVYHDLFVYIERRIIETGQPPSDSELLALYQFTPDRTATDVDSLARTLRKQELIRKGQDAMQTQMTELWYGDPEEAIQNVITGLSNLQAGASEHLGFSDASAMDRLLNVKERSEMRARGEIIGIPTGLPLFDDTGVGWQPAELVTILGRSTIGKSWLLLFFGCVAYFCGKRVLYISPEMSKLHTEFRMDAVLSRFYNMVISNSALINGSVDLQLYEKWLGALSGERRWVTADSTETSTGKFALKDIAALVAAHRPDMLLIDGFHLIGGSKDEQWKVIAEAGQTLKALAQRNGMVVLVAMQVVREAMKTTGEAPDLQHGAYGKALLEDSDRVFSLAMPKGQPRLRYLKVPKTRDGEPVTIRVHLAFDVDVGDIRQISADELREEMAREAD